jgi:predicted RNase H-like HicB family nuclease
MRFVVVLKPDHEVGGFNVVVPALTGCFTQGETVEECLSRAQDAIATYLEGETRESLRTAGVDPDLIVGMVEVETPVLM